MTDILTNYIYVPLAVILLFGAAVFVHEFGHYWVARRRGMKVEAFAIGFGPKLFSWVKDGIEYSWRLIPAGGFVKLPQMVTSEALEGKNDAEHIPPASPLSKILVAFAGPFMNIVFAFAIGTVLYFVGLPMLVNPSIIGYVDPNSAEGKLGIREGDKIVSVNNKRAATWGDVQMAATLAATNVIPVVIERNGERKTYQLEAKSSPLIGGKFLDLDSKDHPEIEMVKEGPAKEAGLQEKDVVLKFGGVTVSGVKQLQTLIQARPGQPTDIDIQRGEKRLSLKVTPRNENGKGFLNVALGSSSKNVYEVQKPGPTPLENISDVLEKTFSTLNAVFFRSKQTGVSPKDLSGPIGIISILASQVKIDYRLALNFLVLLNVNLAILNLLPFPVLDGGHILLSLIEAALRRPIPVKIQEYATTVFAVVLIGFILFVSFWDVKRFSLFKALYQQENQVEQAPKAAPAE